MLFSSIKNSLNELIDLLNQIDNSVYTQKCPALSNSTIGEHNRHILEMFICLENAYEIGMVNYDKRERNIQIQTNTDFAIIITEDIKKNLEKPNKKIDLIQVINGQEVVIESNYQRELLYNLEHCIHHQALIKVAILQFDNITINANFGVARSTIEYRNQCAQ